MSSDEHSQGSKNAVVTLTEFADYECSYCGEADVSVKKLQKAFGTDLRFVFRNFPLREIHPHALAAAAFAEAAAAQDAFWPMHDMLFQHQNELSEEAILEYARALNLDADRLVADVSSAAVQARIDRDLLEGEDIGVQGTPSFVINGELHQGDTSFVSLVAAIEGAGGTVKRKPAGRRAVV